MTKNELYDKLITAYHRHQKNDTLCTTYTDQVIKLVNQYLAEKETAVEVVDVKPIDPDTVPGPTKSTRDYWAEDVKHMQELSDWMNKQWNY